MPTITGTIERVGNWIGGSDFVGYIDAFKIGGTSYRRIRCTSDVYDLLTPGAEATVVINRVMWMKREILGVKLRASGQGWAISVPRFLIMIVVHIPLVAITIIIPFLLLVSLPYSVWSIWRLIGDYKQAKQFI